MTRILIASDLHLEFSDITLDASTADIVVLAGDIHEGAAGIEWAKSRFAQPVIYVAGNHEFYNGEIGAVTAAMKAAAVGSNVHVLDDEAVTISGVRILGAVLWTDFALYGEQVKSEAFGQCLKFMPDFKIVSYGSEILAPEDTIAMHARSRDWLAGNLALSHDGPTVVVTHHAPHRGSLAARFAEDPVSAAFVSDLEAMILEAGPALWIHGHTHTSFDYQVGPTRVVCNPRGYTRKPNAHRENPGFARDFSIEV
ncbi:MAG TPA: metallophosphoesterase [Alphaproteobacteria bacterium]|nr:metallophosphoesterase [Alphaproteobacteria bacterium]